jgi:hypothetical protein
MEQTNVSRISYTQQILHTGRPDLPSTGGRPLFDQKRVDPSSSPKGERCPIPSFFENRVKPSEFKNK